MGPDLGLERSEFLYEIALTGKHFSSSLDVSFHVGGTRCVIYLHLICLLLTLVWRRKSDWSDYYTCDERLRHKQTQLSHSASCFNVVFLLCSSGGWLGPSVGQGAGLPLFSEAVPGWRVRLILCTHISWPTSTPTCQDVVLGHPSATPWLYLFFLFFQILSWLQRHRLLSVLKVFNNPDPWIFFIFWTTYLFWTLKHLLE